MLQVATSCSVVCELGRTRYALNSGSTLGVLTILIQAITVTMASNLNTGAIMSKSTNSHSRRQFLGAVSAGSAAALVPMIIPASALGRDGSVAPSERIVVGGIGIGRRG